MMGNWAGTGKRLDVHFDGLSPLYQRQLSKREMLGKGRYGEVFRTEYRDVEMARKSMKLRPGISGEQLRQLKI